MESEVNILSLLEREGLEYILGVKLRSLKEVREEVIKDLLTVRVVRLRYGDKYYLVRTELNGKAYLGFRAAGVAVPPRVLEIGEGENVVGTSELIGEKCPNIGKF